MPNTPRNFVKGFSTQSQQCTYDVHNMCKPALATALFSTISFTLGAITSVISGFLVMKIATYANARTILEARKGVGKAYIVAFRSGAVMGLFEAITGYGLGGSSMALFGRVGGGIYTKVVDVGADLVGKIERNIPKDDPRNPLYTVLSVWIKLPICLVIADSVRDNVGDIAGMGSDLFGSYAESSCVALVVASISSFGINHEFTAMCYPLLVSSVGIILIIFAVLMTVGVAIVSFIALPSSFTIFNFDVHKVVQNWQLFLCVCVSLWVGLIIGFVPKYYTSNAYTYVVVWLMCDTDLMVDYYHGSKVGNFDRKKVDECDVVARNGCDTFDLLDALRNAFVNFEMICLFIIYEFTMIKKSSLCKHNEGMCDKQALSSMIGSALASHFVSLDDLQYTDHI
ncbi:pyrophosphate-energized vacuolar membrane proton pump [Tanacetum coccineum]|uniref:H(+)-exporting diphosphatase n=1 Tax=Tanacetum coccineum TaxID=301880 RepID=A0ABQ5FIW2_9ASTR